MADIFEEINRNFKKDFVPTLVRYLKDPNNKISENISSFLNDPKELLSDLFEKSSKNKEHDDSDQINYIEIDQNLNEEYEDLFNRLKDIEKSMVKIQNLLEE